MIAASWGWGLNSTWMIVKAIEEGRPPDVVVSCDTGAEHEDTYCMERWYAENVWRPVGLEYVRLHPATHPCHYDKRVRGRTLLEFCREESYLPLAASRWCSADWKARPGDDWMEARGVTENWLGFTAEETRRVIRRGCEMPGLEESVNLMLPGMDAPKVKRRKRGREKPWRVRAPLWEDGDTRRDCAVGLGRLGYPVPDKSGCGICPFNARNILRWARAGDWKWGVLGIDPDVLPELVPPGEVLGEITAEASAATGIPEGLQLVAAGADKACEVVGAGCLEPDVGCLSYGTAATLNTTRRRYVEAVPMIPPSTPTMAASR